MLKKILPLVFVPLLMGGCAAMITNLTPTQQVRNSSNLYPVEVALTSRQQTLRWDSIKPQIVVGTEFYPMHPTSLMTNRWEGLVPVPAGANLAHYHYKLDYLENAFGPPKPGSASSPDYTLRILDR
jgi:poly-D-alanine transfer protein DltD